MDEAKDAEHKLQENIEAIYEMIKSVRKSGPSELADLAQDAATKASLDLIKVTEDVKQSSEVLVKMAKEYMVNKDAMKEELIMTSPSEELPVHEQENEGQAPLPFKDVLLTYAMKKVELLKQEMDKARAEGERKLEEALQVERRDGEKKTHAQLQIQEERIKREYEVILQKRVSRKLTKKLYHFFRFGHVCCLMQSLDRLLSSRLLDNSYIYREVACDVSYRGSGYKNETI